MAFAVKLFNSDHIKYMTHKQLSNTNKANVESSVYLNIKLRCVYIDYSGKQLPVYVGYDRELYVVYSDKSIMKISEISKVRASQ